MRHKSTCAQVSSKMRTEHLPQPLQHSQLTSVCAATPIGGATRHAPCVTGLNQSQATCPSVNIRSWVARSSRPYAPSQQETNGTAPGRTEGPPADKPGTRCINQKTMGGSRKTPKCGRNKISRRWTIQIWIRHRSNSSRGAIGPENNQQLDLCEHTAGKVVDWQSHHEQP